MRSRYRLLLKVSKTLLVIVSKISKGGGEEFLKLLVPFT
jgi:hypothetical protein